jgi:hypothetical protein
MALSCCFVYTTSSMLCPKFPPSCVFPLLGPRNIQLHVLDVCAPCSAFVGKSIDNPNHPQLLGEEYVEFKREAPLQV